MLPPVRWFWSERDAKKEGGGRTEAKSYGVDTPGWTCAVLQCTVPCLSDVCFDECVSLDDLHLSTCDKRTDRAVGVKSALVSHEECYSVCSFWCAINVG